MAELRICDYTLYTPVEGEEGTIHIDIGSGSWMTLSDAPWLG